MCDDACIVFRLQRSINQMCIKLAAVRYTDQPADIQKSTTPSISLKIGIYVAHHVLSHTLKGFPVASSSLAVRVENDDIRKINDPFDFAQNRPIGSKSFPELYPKRITRCIQ